MAITLGLFVPPAAAQSAPTTQPTTSPSTAPRPETAPLNDANVAPSSATVEPKDPVETTTAASPVGEQDDPRTAGQTSPDAANATDIIVVGTRASLQSAIARKRNAGTVVDSIVADDIASFPDKNVGESLARITGVQLSRDFGEGTQVSIRGVEPDLNRVEINGVSQSSATGSRAGDFRELATELVKSIDVYKGYAADLTEGGIGGTVSVETRRPLELKKPLGTLVFSEQHLDLTQDWRPRATLVVGSPKFLLDGLGVLLNVTYDDKSTRGDYASNTNYSRFADFDQSGEKTVADPTYSAFNTYASCANVGGTNTANATARRLACETQFFDWVATQPRYRNLVRRDKRLSGDAVVQYEFAHNFRAFAQLQFNDRNQRLFDTNYLLDTNRFERFQQATRLATGLNGATSRPQILSGTSTVDANHVVTSYTTALQSINIGSATAPVYNGSSNILSVQRRDFEFDQKSRYYLGGFDWNFDRFQFKGLASHSESSTVGQTNLISLATGISGMQIDSRNELGIPVFTYPNTIDPADPSIYTDFARAGNTGQTGPGLAYRPSDYGNSEDQLKFDADWQTEVGPLKSIEFGGQFRWQDYFRYDGGGVRVLSAPGVTPLVTQATANVNYTTNIVPTVTARTTRTGNGTFTNQITQAEYLALINALGTQSGGAALFTGLDGAPSSIPNRIAFANFNSGTLGQLYDLSGFDQDLVRQADNQSQIPTYTIKETIAAGYLKANLDQQVFGMRLTGNAGLRYIFTKDTSTGSNTNRVTRFTGVGSATETVTLSVQQIALTNSYTDILPAFNAALEITPDLVLRGNWAKNLARPRPTDLVPAINCVDDQTNPSIDDVCTAGNPQLQPYRANQWEVNLSWFPNRDTLLSVGYYKKDIKSFVIPAVVRSGVDLYQDGVTYTVRQPINGFGAILDGVEASAQTVFTFLPNPLDGFGASGNVTYARPIRTNLINSATNLPIDEYPGLSKWTYNASVFYDKGWLNARLSYNYRSDWLETVASSTNGNLPIYRRNEAYIDGKVTFRFPQWHYSLFMEMQNIGREYSKTYIKNIGTSEVYYPGQRFFAGLQLKF